MFTPACWRATILLVVALVTAAELFQSRQQLIGPEAHHV